MIIIFINVNLMKWYINFAIITWFCNVKLIFKKWRLIKFHVWRIFLSFMFVALCLTKLMNIWHIYNWHTRKLYNFTCVNFFKIMSKWECSRYISIHFVRPQCVFLYVFVSLHKKIYRKRRDLWKAKLRDKNRDYPIISYFSQVFQYEWRKEQESAELPRSNVRGGPFQKSYT